MATDKDFADHVAGLVSGISLRRMFGEYGVFVGEKMVGVLCDNQLFLKPTPGALAALGDVELVSPFPRAKPYALIDDMHEDGAGLSRIVAGIAEELPEPKPKKPRKGKA